MATEAPEEITPRPLMRADEVCALIGVSDQTLRDWYQRGHFPKPVRYGLRLRVWYQDEVHEWRKTRPRVA